MPQHSEVSHSFGASNDRMVVGDDPHDGTSDTCVPQLYQPTCSGHIPLPVLDVIQLERWMYLSRRKRVFPGSIFVVRCKDRHIRRLVDVDEFVDEYVVAFIVGSKCVNPIDCLFATFDFRRTTVCEGPQ